MESHFIIFWKGQMLRNKDQPSWDEGLGQRDKSEGGNRTDFGIQVDLNFNPETVQTGQYGDENLQSADMKSALSVAQRRKQAKKQSKKRKREKSQEMQRQARRQIGNIIQELYERTAHFQDYAEKIQVLVELVYNNDFRDYLDQLIRMRVTYIQKSIWEYTQCILHENPFERNQDHAFYSQMVDEIYQRFLDIEESSRQIEKIINIYLKYAYQKNESKEEIVYNNLAINTFNYMIETDDTLKNLLHICEKKISPSKEITRKKLEELISLIDSYYDDKEDEDQSSTSCANDDIMSTGHSEEDENFLEKRRRRRKIKESELTTNEESLTKRLEGLMIREDDREPCRVSEEWVRRMGMKGVKYRVS